MGDTQRKAKLSLLTEVEQATLQRSIAALRKLQEEERDLRSATVQRIEASRAGLRGLVAHLKEESIVTVEATRDTEKHAVALGEVSKAARSAASAQEFYTKAVMARYSGADDLLKGVAVGSPMERGLQRNDSTASSALSALSTLLPGGAGDAARIAGNFERLSQQLGKSGEEAAALDAILGPAALALGAIAIAFSVFEANVKKANEQLDAYVSLEESYFTLIETGTTEQVQAAIDAKRAEAEAYDNTAQSIASAADQLSTFDKWMDALKTVLEQEFPVLKNILGETQAGKYDEEIKKRDAAREAARRYEDGLKSEQVKKNDAAEAAKQAAQEVARQSAQTERLAKASDTAAKSQDKQTEATLAAAKAAEQLSGLYSGIVDKTQQFAQQALKAEEDRAKSIADLNKRYAQQEADNKRHAAAQARIDAIRDAAQSVRLAANLDFAGLADLRDQQRVEAATNAIQQQLDAEDKRIAYARDIASIDERVADARMQAAQQELDYMKQTVAEFAKLKGGFGDPTHYSDAQLRSVYSVAQASAGLLPNAAVTPPQANYGNYYYGKQGGGVTNNVGGPTFNIYDATDPHAVVQQVQAQMDKWWNSIYRGG